MFPGSRAQFSLFRTVLSVVMTVNYLPGVVGLPSDRYVGVHLQTLILAHANSISDLTYKPWS